MKTPEQMAEEYTKDWWGNLPEAEGMRKSARENFLAGYQAAINSPEKPDGWISVKDCIKPSEPHRITHKIRQMVDEVTQSHIDDPSRSYVDIANLEAILKYVAEDEV